VRLQELVRHVLVSSVAGEHGLGATGGQKEGDGGFSPFANFLFKSYVTTGSKSPPSGPGMGNFRNPLCERNEIKYPPPG